MTSNPFDDTRLEEIKLKSVANDRLLPYLVSRVLPSLEPNTANAMQFDALYSSVKETIELSAEAKNSSKRWRNCFNL